MAEILSQQEIDALLNNIKSGTEQKIESSSEKEAILYDFRLPNRISKNQLRVLRSIFENFAESFSSFLVTKLQTVVNINVTSVDQIYYSEYVLSVANPACLFTFQIKDTDVKGILELNNDLALSLVDKLLGGNGLGTKQTKIITPIEQKVLNVVVERVMQDLKKAWQTIDNMEFEVERFEPDIDFAQITSQSESVLLISFEILIGEQSYLMNICFATFAFDNILARLSSQKLSSIRAVKHYGKTAREVVSQNLSAVALPIQVELGTTKLSVKEIMEMEIGDIIRLDTKLSDDQKVRTGKHILFLGRIGVSNNKKAIKVTKKLLEEK
ncbi:MAG: flagellar motor switch protein FliM [Stygiobacter sp.]|jgi:flagellar motor switch protein FliM|uniref:Flagellar motor switch protein FliM n=1 Tax=Stygiobacter electus TaxID=3032292 RepID=A0AAE3TDA9_9BACT|nr:flagellar motor switch protein FliM [Stygiobacter electus]MDF1611252.1 flagellar motor switch protein FliM [Stygiobacter electus]